MHIGKKILFVLTILITTIASGQSFKGWHLLDPATDSMNGISLEKAYKFLQGKKSKPVIVAVIDGGIDTTQEDLVNVLWHNPKEIAGNGIDDDGNGYIDDVYGWNFLGGKDGKNIERESREEARVYFRYKEKFANRKINTDSLNQDEKDIYQNWVKAAEMLEIKPEDQVELMFLEVAYNAARKYEKILQAEMKKDTFNVEEVEAFMPMNQTGKQAKLAYINFMKITDLAREEKNTVILQELSDFIEDRKYQIQQKDIPPPNIRDEIVGDDYFNFNDKYYGNKNVMGPSAEHGTHVSGTIAAQRNNGTGMDGIADNVKIMALRAVPDGDEYDKDIALSIRYAVDNGAKVINMSFGKELSPQKKWVDDAIRYAAAHDVLLVHAAGNDGLNADENLYFPNPHVDNTTTTADNFITVGASTDPKISGRHVADFSNYGKQTVNVFAPGEKIYATIVGTTKYGFMNGTSMAAPVVSGIAALLRSYFPDLSARQIKYVIETSVVKTDSLKVKKPGSRNEEVFLFELCTSGGVVNANAAVHLAATLKPEKRPVETAPLLKNGNNNIPAKQ